MSLFKGLLTLLLLAAASASTMTTTEFEVGEEAGTIFQPKTSSGLVDAIEMVEKTQPVPANAWKTHTAPVPGSNHAEKVTNMNMDDAQAKQPAAAAPAPEPMFDRIMDDAMGKDTAHGADSSTATTAAEPAEN